MLIAWRECDGDRHLVGATRCLIRTRWRLAGAWERGQTVADDASLEWGHLGLVMDRRGRALLAFNACEPDENIFLGECALQVVGGRRGRFGAVTPLDRGVFGDMASNRRGDLLMLHSRATGGPPYHVDYYAHIGSTADGFGPPVPIREPDGSGPYQVTVVGLGVDDGGNASFAYQNYDSIAGWLFRYRR